MTDEELKKLEYEVEQLKENLREEEKKEQLLKQKAALEHQAKQRKLKDNAFVKFINWFGDEVSDLFSGGKR